MCVSPEIVERSREEKGTGPGWWASGPGKSPVVWRKCEQVLDWGEGRHGHGDGARSKMPPGAAPNSSAAQVSLGAPHDQQCSLYLSLRVANTFMFIDLRVAMSI